jgi:hypothetical protein
MMRWALVGGGVDCLIVGALVAKAGNGEDGGTVALVGLILLLLAGAAWLSDPDDGRP